VNIKLVGGRAHKKHTVGGDFRQAVYRAVRQGLMQAESVLLEPFYDFRIEIPQEYTGRAMTDIERMSGKCGEPMIENGRALLTGSGPVSTFRSYASEVTAYSRGLGTVAFSFGGYDICHNGAEIKARSGYNPDSDIHNPSSSVFCAGGAGFTVEWDRVREYMHEAGLDTDDTDELPSKALSRRVSDEAALGTEEIDEIIARASSSNRKQESNARRRRAREMLEKKRTSASAAKPAKKQYMLIDGYNVLFSDDTLTELAKTDLSAARNKLLERISNYAGTAGFPVAVVFDAYRVENHPAETIKMNNTDIVFTKTAETADRYIERFAHLKASEFDICVVTSDLTEQVIIMGAGCRRMFSEEFFEEMQMREQLLREKYGVK
jgi:predicted RNA-binding protein with PIN domain